MKVLSVRSLDADLVTRVSTGQEPRILAVGDLALWKSSFGSLPVHKGVHFADIDLITGGLLEDISPDLVVSPVLTPSFDCIDVAFRLADQSFSGAYRALTRNLPNPSMVRREVRTLCPALDFDIVRVLDDGLKLR